MGYHVYVSDCRIVLKVTHAQREALKQIAELSGSTLSNYVRRKLDLPPEKKGERKDLPQGRKRRAE